MDAVQRAKADGADLVVFAEQSISGAPAYDLLNKVNFLDLCEEALVEIAACCDGISALVGLPVQEGRWTVSAAAFIQNRKIVGYITRKHILQRDDATFLYPGRGREFIQVAGRKIAVVVGEDIMHPDECSGCADAVINIGSSKYARQRIEKRYDFFARNGLPAGNGCGVRQSGGSQYRCDIRRLVGRFQCRRKTAGPACGFRGGLSGGGARWRPRTHGGALSG